MNKVLIAGLIVGILAGLGHADAVVSVATPELFQNNDLESGSSSFWILRNSVSISTDSHGGNYCLQMGPGAAISQNLKGQLIPSATYTISAWVKIIEPTSIAWGSPRLGFSVYPDLGSTFQRTADYESGISKNDPSLGWQYISSDYIFSSTDVTLNLYAGVLNFGFNGLSEVDDLSLIGHFDRVIQDTVPVDPAPVTISNIALLNLTTDGVTITWNTDEDADSQVNYGLDTIYSSTVSDSVLLTTHSIDLTGLLPNTTYHYRVGSADASGNLTQSQDIAFKTYMIGLELIASTPMAPGSSLFYFLPITTVTIESDGTYSYRLLGYKKEYWNIQWLDFDYGTELYRGLRQDGVGVYATEQQYQEYLVNKSTP